VTPANQLSFSIEDQNNGSAVSPANVSLAMLGEFQKDVSEFLRGSGKEVNLEKIVISIQHGSLKLVANGLLVATSLWTDLQQIKITSSLSSIDPKRAAVLKRWQTAAKKNPHRNYLVSNERVSLLANNQSGFSRFDDVWFRVEKYLVGTIYDMGGDPKANVHIRLENGSTLKVDSTKEVLADQDARLYKQNMLYVEAEENLQTGDLKNIRLISFVDYRPQYNEAEHKQLIEQGTLAWASIADANAWLEDLRGN
jgi:hypothetical protein